MKYHGFFVLNLTTEDIIRLCLEMHFLVTYKCEIIYQGAVIYRQILQLNTLCII